MRQRLYAIGFVVEFIPFIVLFTLWFDDNGISIGQLSIVFVMWAIAVVVLEVPSGMLADRVDRRRLVAASLALRAAGVVAWLLWPSLTGLLVGGGLYAIHEAAASGAWEALVHDQLEAVDEESDYSVVMARIGQFSNIGIASAALIATPLLALGMSLESLGWATVALHLVTIGLLLSLPDVRWVVERSRQRAEDDEEDASLRAVLTSLHRGVVAIPVAAGVAIGGVAIIDEYVPLLARERGLDDAIVPLVVASVWVGLLAGGEIAARWPSIASFRLAVLTAIGGLATLVALLTNPAWTLPLIAVGYAAIEATWVVADARLQAQVSAHVRATVTSVREFGVGLVAGIALAIIGLMSDGDDPTPGLLVTAAALLLSAPLVAALPHAVRRPRRPTPPPPSAFLR
jgi:MFS family permease